MLRREFIKNSLASLATYGLSTQANMSKADSSHVRDYLIGSYSANPPLSDPKTFRAPDAPSEIRIWSFLEKNFRFLNSNCFGHTFVASPRSPEIVVTCSKWSHGATIFDVRKGRIIKFLTAPEGFRFFGHSAFDKDGCFFLSAANESLRGFLLKYECPSGKLVGRIATGGGSSHDFFFMTSDVVVVANRISSSDETQASLTWVSVAEDRVIREKKLPYAAHLLRLSDEIIVISSGPADQGHLFAFDQTKDTLVDVRSSPDFREETLAGEALSLCRLNDNLVAATVDHGQSVILWDLKTNSVATKKLAGNTHGLAASEGALWVSTSIGDLFSLPLSDRAFSILPARKVFNAFANSAHLALITV